MTTISDIQAAIGAVLRPAGFKRSRRNWRRADEQVVQVVNLQKSEYGDQCYLNIGFFLRQLDPQQAPPAEHRCHVRVRGDHLWKRCGTTHSLHAVLAPSYDELAPAERGRLLEAFLVEDLLPVLERGKTVDALAQLVADGVLPDWSMVVDARRVLFGEPEHAPVAQADFRPIPDFDEQCWTGGRWQYTDDPVEPWLRVDVHDSDVAEVTFAPADAPAQGRFFMGIHPAAYFGTSPAVAPEDPAVEAQALAMWAQHAADARVDAEAIRSLMATADDQNAHEDDFVEETAVRLLGMLGISVPDPGQA